MANSELTSKNRGTREPKLLVRKISVHLRLFVVTMPVNKPMEEKNGITRFNTQRG
jgi:hypothetical protein